MDETFEFKIDYCGAIFSFRFSLSKHGSVFQYQQGREFNLNDAYLSFFTKVDGLDKPVPAKKGFFPY